MADEPKVEQPRYDETEALFLFDRFKEKHRELLGVGDRSAAAAHLLEEFAGLAERMGLQVERQHASIVQVWIKEDDDFAATITLTTGAKFLVRRGRDSGNNRATLEVPIRYNTVTLAFEGPRPEKLPAGVQMWEAKPRSALGVLAEAVLAAMEGRQLSS